MPLHLLKIQITNNSIWWAVFASYLWNVLSYVTLTLLKCNYKYNLHFVIGWCQKTPNPFNWRNWCINWCEIKVFQEPHCKAGSAHPTGMLSCSICSCMIIDDNGFVIVHKDFIGTSSEIKKQHLVIKVRTNRLTFESLFCIKGREPLIRTRLIRSFT